MEPTEAGLLARFKALCGTVISPCFAEQRGTSKKELPRSYPYTSPMWPSLTSIKRTTCTLTFVQRSQMIDGAQGESDCANFSPRPSSSSVSCTDQPRHNRFREGLGMGLGQRRCVLRSCPREALVLNPLRGMKSTAASVVAAGCRGVLVFMFNTWATRPARSIKVADIYASTIVKHPVCRGERFIIRLGEA